MSERSERGFGTAAVHGPQGVPERGPDRPPERGGEAAGGAEGGSRPHATPLHQTSGFAFTDPESAVAAFRGSGDYIYSRLGNPTVRVLERHLTLLEAHAVPGGAIRREPEELDSCFFASGMAAITAVALGVGVDGRIVCQDGIYGTTVAHMQGLARYGVDVDFVPAGDLEALHRALEDGRPPALVFVETPANPLLQVTDVRAAAEAAHDAGALLAVDATFATPALLRPLVWGADFSVHSTTKFVSGHGLALGGVVTGAAGQVRERVVPARKFFGAAPDPFAAWLTLHGLRTLDVRMARHAANAAALADALRRHGRVERVHHPDPAALPAGQLASAGPMLSFEVAGGRDEALGAIRRLGLATLVPSLGTLDTVVQHPDTMSHGLLPESRRRELGIGPGLVRVSVGLEDPADLVRDFRRALDG